VTHRKPKQMGHEFFYLKKKGFVPAWAGREEEKERLVLKAHSCH
jgi:hypothetical protein